jgi:N-acetylglucosamine-6-phosphate deacetylase
VNDSFIIQGGAVITPNGIIEEGSVWIENGIIAKVGHPKGMPAEKIKQVDATNKYVVPGFIDVHVHGGGGGDVMDGTWDALNAMTRTHARFGTTGLLATTMTAEANRLTDCLAAVSRFMGERPSGAAILGVHLEGPFIHPKYKGAQNEKWVRPATIKELTALVDSAQGQLKWITMAGELVESDAIFEFLRDHGIVCSIGHSGAQYHDVCRCIRHGFSHVTHLFNAMPSLHHREVGIVGAALLEDALTYEVIADGIHVSPEALRMLERSGTLHKMMLVTDAIRAAGLTEGEYELGGQPVYVKNGEARLQNGTLAGSVLTMNQAVRNMMKYTGISLESAVSLAAMHPAKKLGIDQSKGSIEQGKDADLLIIDRELNVEWTFVQGRMVYQRQGDNI